MKLTDFDVYRQLLLDQSGLDLTQDKTYLLESRLKPVAKKWGYPTLEMMTMALNGVPEPGLINDIVEAMTTNETSFFRDGKPFESFEKHILPYLAQTRAKAKNLRIWCAASSSGQEPYSLAIALKELQPQLPNWKIQILATDISEEILQQAAEGRYTQFEVQRGLPVQLLMKYFKQDDDKWQLDESIRSMVTFYRLNLIEDMRKLDMFDIVFCRNVLIYFNEETKRTVIENMLEHMEPDGFMVLGSSESPLGITDKIKGISEHRGLYVRADGPHADAAKATGT